MKSLKWFIFYIISAFGVCQDVSSSTLDIITHQLKKTSSKKITSSTEEFKVQSPLECVYRCTALGDTCFGVQFDKKSNTCSLTDSPCILTDDSTTSVIYIKVEINLEILKLKTVNCSYNDNTIQFL